jgi:cytoskeletal protein RodZ
VEKLADQIGERLRGARERAGLSVEDVVFRTHFTHNVIEALEDGDFSVFSSPTYAKSFLKQYSDFLNVDAYQWIDSLQPAPFVAGETARSLLDVASPKKDEKPPEPGISNGWLSALGILAFSIGMIYVAMRSYDFFEARFGGEVTANGPKKEAVDIEINPAPPEIPAKQSSVESPPKKPDDELSKPPPRAIIVRDP